MGVMSFLLLLFFSVVIFILVQCFFVLVILSNLLYSCQQHGFMAVGSRYQASYGAVTS